MNTQRVTALVVKELKRLVREPANLFMVLIFPMILTVAFGAAFGGLGSGGSDTAYTIGLVDLDVSASADWATSFRMGITETGMLVIAEYDDNETAHRDLLQGKIDAVVVLPEDFGDSVDSFIAHPTEPSLWVNSTVGLAVDQGSIVVGAAVPPMIQHVLTATIFGDQAAAVAMPLTIGVPTRVASSHLTQFDYMVPGLFAYSAIFVTMLVAQAFSTEREQGILQRISVTPTTSSEVIMSQIVANLVAGASQVAIVYMVASLMGFRSQASLGATAYALVLVLFLVLCNVGFGLITASLVKSSGAATGVSFVFILPQMLLGTFVPASREIARFVPSYYITDALTSLFLRGAPVGSPVILMDLLIIAVVGIGVAAVGVVVYKRFGRRKVVE
ncbi:ABC transporter permease [Candidatus Bathyarchaeota archaeon]|nr:ABC transporter permease [Candidatus Bathyarchaeota archaeon]